MPDELKEGDEFDLRLKIAGFYEDGYPIFAEKESGIHFFVGPETKASMRKVRPGTYEVTARDVAKMVCRAHRETPPLQNLLGEWADYGWNCRPNQPDFKLLRRWVHCRLRELRRKRGGR